MVDDYFAPLAKILSAHYSPAAIESIRKAYLLAREAHGGQSRFSGEPYITHPVAVAGILAQMHLDAPTLQAALLHDVIEDTKVSKQTIAEQFGQDVAELVDGVSKLTQIKFENKAEAQAENFRKMVLAMAKDIRVVIIKLADRLHNMRTLGVLPEAKRKRIALETLEIYAPIANRLGMHNFRIEFEELGFAARYPLRYKVLKKSVTKARGNRKEILAEIEATLQKALRNTGIAAIKILGREKHLYSIYKKMVNKHIAFSEIMDRYAFRIIVSSVDSCYRVLGSMHTSFKPVPERFKDYIAIPKANGYQSLHTVLFGPYGVPIEIQIRTDDMDAMAESGIAAHWLYKSSTKSKNRAHLRAQAWLQGLVDMQKGGDSSLEFIENVKIDLFPDEVYVFTPKGNILELPRGACPVDFAYAIHTDIGNACVAAKINRRLSPLSSQLLSGQTVEIVTAPEARPNPAWLNFVVTAKARSEIRQSVQKQKLGESIELGRRLLERALSTLSLRLEDISSENLRHVLRESKFKNLDQLLESMGLGSQIPLAVARRLAFAVKDEVLEEEKEKQKATRLLAKQPLIIKGSEGLVVTFADCCRPIPGDVIVGILSAGHGMVIHREQCKEVEHLHGTPTCIYLSWQDETPGEFYTEIVADVYNKRGVLAELAATISHSSADIEDVHVKDKDGRYSEVSMLVTVRDRKHLAQVLRRIRALETTIRVVRV
jgi:guanosine-3',5'-bis(diphosphate) 3'-pyrophosphohydrolase